MNMIFPNMHRPARCISTLQILAVHSVVACIHLCESILFSLFVCWFAAVHRSTNHTSEHCSPKTVSVSCIPSTPLHPIHINPFWDFRFIIVVENMSFIVHLPNCCIRIWKHLPDNKEKPGRQPEHFDRERSCWPCESKRQGQVGTSRKDEIVEPQCRWCGHYWTKVGW